MEIFSSPWINLQGLLVLVVSRRPRDAEEVPLKFMRSLCNMLIDTFKTILSSFLYLVYKLFIMLERLSWNVSISEVSTVLFSYKPLPHLNVIIFIWILFHFYGLALILKTNTHNSLVFGNASILKSYFRSNCFWKMLLFTLKCSHGKRCVCLAFALCWVGKQSG